MTSYPSSKSARKDLVRLCRLIGCDVLLVQAGGGNISIKTSPGRMAIKASGCRLCEVTPQKGWTWSSPDLICRGLRAISPRLSSAKKELDYANLLGQATEIQGRRPSMEAGFHAIFPDRYVIHLHSLAGILMGLLPRRRAMRLLQTVSRRTWSVEWIPPSLPGYALSQRLLRKPSASRRRARPTLWVLQNHGIIWTGPNRSSVMRECQELERRLRTYFHLRNYPFPHQRGSVRCRLKSKKPSYVCFCKWPQFRWSLNPLFPDFVIYFDLWSKNRPDLARNGDRTFQIVAADRANFQDKAEVLYAHAVVYTVAARFGSVPSLPKTMIRALKNMETERLRIQQARRS